MQRSIFRRLTSKRTPRAVRLAKIDPANEPWQWNRLLIVVASVVEVLRSQPGIGRRKLRLAVRSLRGKCTDSDTDAAVLMLGPAIHTTIGPRGDHHYTLELVLAPPKVRAYFESSGA